jgi:hypothetical protein
MIGIFVITGGRDFQDDGRMKDFFKTMDGSYAETVLFHGNARGADQLAEYYAKLHGWKVRRVPVDTALDGPWPGAGNRRNERMLGMALEQTGLVHVAAFPGKKSKGTWNCVRAAWALGLDVGIPGKPG